MQAPNAAPEKAQSEPFSTAVKASVELGMGTALNCTQHHLIFSDGYVIVLYPGKDPGQTESRLVTPWESW